MNQQYSTPQNANISNIPRNNSKEKMQKYISSFSNFYINKNKNFLISDTQRNLAKFKSQKKPRQKDSYVKHFTENNPQNFFENNKNYSLMRNNNNNSKSKLKNKQKNKSHGLLKANLEIETNPSNNIDNISTKNNSRINTNNNNNKRYRKNISEHDLVNNILNTFTNYNFPKNLNPKINYSNYSSKKKLNYNKNKSMNNNNITNGIKKPTKSTNNTGNINRPRTASDTKLFRSMSGYSYVNNNLFYTNSFFNGDNNQITNNNYIPTWSNNPEHNNKIKNNKGPIIGKIVKNYKNNDLNCIFNMNLIPPMSPVNNIQDYFKNLYKVEYNGKKFEKSAKKEKEKDNDINDLKDLKDKKNKDEKIFSVEEIHYYYINMIQNGKKMEKKLMKK